MAERISATKLKFRVDDRVRYIGPGEDGWVCPGDMGVVDEISIGRRSDDERFDIICDVVPDRWQDAADGTYLAVMCYEEELEGVT